MEALQEIVGMVIACQRKSWQGLLHLLLEPFPIIALYPLYRSRQGIIIKGGGDISVELVEILQIVLGVHQPLRITEERDGEVGGNGSQTVELGKSNIEFR